MSQTRKDIAQQSTYRTVLEVKSNNDGTFEITVNEEVVETRVPERWLEEELCAKRGFCGDELTSIKRQLEEKGRAIVFVIHGPLREETLGAPTALSLHAIYSFPLATPPRPYSSIVRTCRPAALLMGCHVRSACSHSCRRAAS